MFLCFIVLAVSVELSTQCFNENGEDRDWFIMLKMPGGLNYLYADDTQNTLTRGSSNLGNQANPVAQVLNLMYIKGQNFILYNDKSPDGSAPPYRGHTKGAVVWQTGGAVRWLIHSVPGFPPVPGQGSGYQYPDSGINFGQSFLCIKATYADLGVIANDLYYSWPYIYDHFALDLANFPILRRVVNGNDRQNHVPNRNDVRQEIVQDIRDRFIVFSKTGGFGGDIYKDLMAPWLADVFGPPSGVFEMFAETWIRGLRIPSECHDNTHVYNVLHMTNLVGNNYLETEDHSKWAITNTYHVCVGGSNRMTSQIKRGGSSVCLRVGTLAEQIRRSIGEDGFERCNGNQIEEDSENLKEWQKSAASTIGSAHKFESIFALIFALFFQP